ncbi:DUF6418 domain-containing protein [Pectobacterium parmentieri]|uniref:DUF6418 domain-containing protein n=1 Tax=Pectobacterium parmentieri TaxID=1905730 RepID=UPI000EB59CC0|nr:DUF6418 domain-containing protein [Pectobacterium parmentieri]AYH32752.1 hypothetical protein C5E19_14630 [Pectobacterium parmentieri]
MKLIFFLGVILYFFTFVFFEIFGATYFLNIVAVLFFLYYCYKLIKLNGDFSSVGIFFIFSYAVTSVICCIAEFGGYFTEIKQFSYLTGATARNTYLAFFTLHFACLSFNFFKKINYSLVPLGGSVAFFERSFITIIYLCMVGVLFFIGVIYGHPNDYGVDRFYYWNNIAPKWGQSLIYFIQICFIFLGRLFAMTKRKIYVFMLFLGLLSFYMTGDKFTGIFNSIVLFFIPVFILSKKILSEIIFDKKFMMLVGSLFFSLLVVTYFSYLFIYSGDGGKAIEMISVRLFLQAQMWWALDSVSNLFSKDINIIWQNFFGFFNEPEQSGIYFLMKQVAPVNVFYTMFEEGVAFTMAYPSNLIYFFGISFSPLAALGCGIIIGVILSILYRTVVGGSAILLPMVTVLYYSVVQAFLMGNTSHFASVRFLLAFSLVLFFILISNSTKLRKNKK